MEFEKFFEDIKDLIKAIGTSSSANEERDERSVENYVRGNSNTNTSKAGGNTMSNTTEPDPQGDIAVTKAVGNETNPSGNVSVGNAPEGPVPTEETFVSSATSAIAPSKTDEVNTPDTVQISKAATCETCGQNLPVAKADDSVNADEIAKAAACADCGKAMNLCDCMGKAVDEAESKEEAAKETPADEKAEMKKSLWGGAFSPLVK
jgi:hypothetical protein